MPLLGAVVAVVLWACAGPVPVTPSATPTLESPAAQPTHDLVVVLEKPWLLPWSGPNTPREIAERAGLRFCGVEQGPLIDVAIRKCFVDEVVAGREIEFAQIGPTTEGDQIATVFGFEPPGGFSMAVDSTQDQFGVSAWSISFCSRFTPDPTSVFLMDECVSGPVFQVPR